MFWLIQEAVLYALGAFQKNLPRRTNRAHIGLKYPCRARDGLVYWSGLDIARESPELWMRLMRLMMTEGEPFPEIGVSLEDEKNGESRQYILKKEMPCDLRHERCEDCNAQSVGIRLNRYPKCIDHYGRLDNFSAYMCSHGDILRSY